MNLLKVFYLKKENRTDNLIASMGESCITTEGRAFIIEEDFSILYSLNNPIITNKFFKEFKPEYINENDLSYEFKKKLDLNIKNHIIIGFNTDINYIKENLIPLIESYDNIHLNIINFNDEINECFYLPPIEIDDITDEEWEEIKKQIDERMKETRIHQPSIFNIGKINLEDYEPSNIYYNLDLSKLLSVNLIDNEEDEDIYENYTSFSYTDKNSSILIEKTGDDKIIIEDEEGNRITINNAKKDFIINSLNFFK